MGKFLLSTLLLLATVFGMSAETFKLVTSIDQIDESGEYILTAGPEMVGKVQYGIYGLGASKSNNKGFDGIELIADATERLPEITIEIPESLKMFVIEGNSSDGYYLKSGNQYLDATTDKVMKLSDNKPTTSLTMSVSTAGVSTIKCGAESILVAFANATGGVKGTCTFNCYKTAQKSVALYKKEDNLDPSLLPAGLSFPEASYTAELGEVFAKPELTKATDAAAVYSSSNPEVATVDEGTGDVTLVGAGTTTISAKTVATEKYNAGSASYTLTVTKVYKSISDFYTVGKDNKGIVGFPLTVTYVNGTSCYAINGEEATLVYFAKDTDNIYKVGDVIPSGWEGQYSPFNGLDEIKPISTMPEAAENVGFTPSEVESVTKDMINQVVVLKNVTFAAATASGTTKTNFTGILENGNEVTFRNNFADVPSVEAGKYDVTCAISYYVNSKDNSEILQVYPIEYKAVVAPVAPEVPVLVINGKEVTDLTATEDGEVSFVVAEGTEVYYKVETSGVQTFAEVAPEEGYTKYTDPFRISVGQTVSYYAQSVENPELRSEVATASATTPTGVAEIEVGGAGEVRWFDMQGREVKGQPEKGVYVRVANGKASKVIVK